MTTFDRWVKLISMRPGYKHKRRPGLNERLNSRIAEILRQRREEVGLTQQEMADRLGLSQASVCRIEQAYDNLSLTKLDRYSKALGTEITVVFPLLEE